MKTIYAFTLEGDDYHSNRFRYNLRLIAFLLYDKIYNYDGEGYTALIMNDKIKCNKIHKGYTDSEYYLEYNECNEKYFNYEPFLMGDRTFALTIDDQIMDDNVICSLMDETIYEILLISRISYSYSFKKNGYLSKDKNDEKNRKKAILELRNMINGNLQKKKNDFVRKKSMNISMFGRKIGLF